MQVTPWSRHGYLDQSIPFIQKPFSATDLLQKVRDVLESAASNDAKVAIVPRRTAFSKSKHRSTMEGRVCRKLPPGINGLVYFRTIDRSLSRDQLVRRGLMGRFVLVDMAETRRSLPSGICEAREEQNGHPHSYGWGLGRLPFRRPQRLSFSWPGPRVARR